MLVPFLIQAAAFAALAAGHPGGHQRLSPDELLSRQSAALERKQVARKCAESIAAFNVKRRAKRSLVSSVDTSTQHPLSFEKTTCVTAPEVTEGPYYINNEMIRSDMTEDQTGVPLTLDIGVIDVTTCEPMEDVFVEIWAANATGVYSGYSAKMEGFPPPPEGGDHRGPHRSPPHKGPPGEPGRKPGPGGPGGPGRGGMPSPTIIRNETFLRGGVPTDSNGLAELVTIYPGFYSGRTAHIHTMVHMNWKKSDNGTLISSSGSLLHIGQFFFEEAWNDQVYAVSPYSENTNKRTYNKDDGVLDEENADGNNAFVDLMLAGEDITDGLVGYITMGVDPFASYGIMNKNYLNSTGPSR